MRPQLLLVLLMLCAVSQRAQALDAGPLLEQIVIETKTIHADLLEIRGLAFTDVTGTARIEGGVVKIEGIQSAFYRGRAQGRVEIHPDATVKAAFSFENMDLAEFLLRYANVEDAMSGTMSGKVDITLPRSLTTTMHGSIELKVENGTLVSVPLLTELLLGDPGKGGGKDSAQATIRIEQRHAWFTELTVTSPDVDLSGDGSLSFGGMLDLTLSPRTRPAYLRIVPALGDLVGMALSEVSARVGRFHIGGHISEPRFTASPF